MLIIKNLIRKFKTYNGSYVHALKGISFQTIDKGMVFITGKSGSGKSTLLNIIGGLDKSSDGAVLLNGEEITKYSGKKADVYRNTVIGFIFQENNLVNSISVEDNIRISSELMGSNVTKNEINKVLGEVDLFGYGNRMPNDLSTGEKQRVAIARALIKHPQLILADEPTGSLDTKTGIMIMDILKTLSKDKLIIVVTHDIKLASTYGDQIINIADGKLISSTLINKNDFQEEEFVLEHKKKYKMPFLRIVKLVTKSIVLRKVRLSLTIFISVIAFILFGLSTTISQYEKSKSILQSLYYREKTHLSIGEGGHSSILSLDHLNMAPGLTEEDVKKITSLFPDNNFIKAYKYNCNFEEYLADKEAGDFNSIFFNKNFNGSIEITDDLLQILNLKLIEGRLPTQSVTNNEIVVSKYIYNQFEKFNYRDIMGNTIEIQSPKDLIGKIILDNIIVGIVDTNFDASRYFPLSSYNIIDENNDITLKVLEREFKILAKYGLQNAIFVRENYHEALFINPSDNGIYDIDNEIYEEKFNLYFNYSHNGNYNTNIHTSFDSIRTIEHKPLCIYWKEGVVREKLSENEILLPIDAIFDFQIVDDLTYLLTLINNETELLVQDFVLKNYADIKNDFEKVYGASHELDYYRYIMELSSENNQFHVGKNREYFTIIAEQNVYDEYLFPALQSMGFNRSGNGKLINSELQVVGFFTSLSGDSTSDMMIVSDSLFNELLETGQGKYSYLIAGLSLATDVDLSLINLCSNRNQSMELSCTIFDEVTVNNAYMDSIMEFIKDLFFYISIGLSIFVFLLHFNFISYSIYIKSRDIGLLRSLGASRKDVCRLLTYESILISSIIYFISLLGMIILSLVINELFRRKYLSFFTLMDFGLKQSLFLLIIVYSIGIISTIIPIVAFSRKKPIKMLKSL